MHKYIYLLMLLFLCSCHSEAPVMPEPEKPAFCPEDTMVLMDIAEQAYGRPNYFNDFVDVPKDNEIRWEMDSESGMLRITGLKLSYYNGRLPSSIGNLTHLRKLYMDWGTHAGPLPKTLFDCPLDTLRVFGMTKDNDSGEALTVPELLVRLKPTVKYLAFLKCKFNGGIPPRVLETYSQPCELRYMNFYDCGLSGKVTMDYGELNCQFYLQFNRFDDIDWELFTVRGYNIPYLQGNLLPAPPDDVKQSEGWRLYSQDRFLYQTAH